jgi:predicted ATPase/signal transduction histidine kinase
MELKDYTLGDVVHEGAETRVCRAVHRPSAAHVVIKLPVLAAPSPRVLGRLVHEHQVLSLLATTAGVARARELLQQGGTALLVLEDPGFRSLERLLAERGRLPVMAGLRLGRRLAQVLEGVHAAGVMHKDVKPQNVLVDEACEQVTLLDFGIASALAQEATAASIPEALEGTLAYISPEQTGRTARALDARTDLYSLGVLLFEALAGRQPFTERDPLSLVHAHLAKEPPALEELVPEVPSAVGAIIAKLLAKDPERRYQTAKGVAEDLGEALRQWQERGRVEPFALGRKDFSRKLRLPQLLVGRERQVEQVGESFARAARGDVELVLIGGPSGIGKTALVRTVYRDIAKAGRGLLIAGKHDQLAQSTPYAAMAQAFGALMRQWLASPEAVLRSWQAQIKSEVGDNARLIADVVPELDLLMGKLAPVPDVLGEQVLNRQKLTWLNFVRAVTTPNAPLVMFLDDMQWADSATLLILETLLSDVERKELLVIAAYRDNETPPEHPLWKLVTAVDKSGAKVSKMTVGPLSEAQVQTWMTRTLSSEPSRALPLSRVLSQKTRGNPFFLEQLLLSLHRQKQVTRDPESGEWRWNQEEIEQAQVTDNVVALLTDKVREMPEETQQLLGLAACAGHKFRLEELERLSGWERARVTGALWPALREELVVPEDGAYRPAQALGEVEVGERALDAEYRFLHDRVQQASYERIAPEQRVLAHLEIGRRLLGQHRSKGGTAPQLLELVRHLNLGSARMSSAEERTDLARRNLEAARVAKAASSHQLMASLLETAAALLGEGAFRDEPMLSVEIALERLEAAFLLREFDDAEARTLKLLAMPLPPVPRLVVQEIRVRSCVATGQFTRGVELGLSALAEQGIAFPDSDEACQAAVMEETTDLDRWLEQNPNGFDVMPLDPSLEHLLTDALMAQMMMSAALGGRPMLTALAVARSVSETRRRNAITPPAPFGIGSFAHMWSAITGMYRRAACWIEPAVRAAERVGSPMLAECLTLKGVYTVYSTPIDAAAPVFEQVLATGLKSGSFQGTNWGLLGELLFFRVWSGQPLGQVEAQRKARWGLMQRAGVAIGQHVFELTASYCDALMESGSARKLLAEEPLSRGSHSILADGDPTAAGFARVMEAHLFLTAGNFSRALLRAREAEQLRPVMYGNPPVTDVPLWLALSAAKCWEETTDAEELARLRDHIERGLSHLRYLSEGCAENFLHKQHLIEAEYARVQGKTDEAMAKYDEAITVAHEQRFLHIEALAAQFCAEFHLTAGRSRIGALYLQKARDAYARWGALAVVAHLEAKYPTVLKAPVPAVERTITTGTTTTTTTTTLSTGGAALDVKTAVRAAQALSSELDPERVVGRLMELVLENAGAQRGALLLREGEALSLVARLSVAEARIETGLSEPLAESRELSATVVQYAARTGEPVVVGDAHAEARFANDPYLASHAVLSLLALPLTHQGRLLGVLYLEHREVASAFPPARVELLAVIASQAAIALENATLYANLSLENKGRRQAEEEVRKLNSELEQKVIDRTRALQEAQARVIQLEKEATETQMAGGFAHEMRNALAGARMVLTKVYQQNVNAEPWSVCLENTQTMADIFLYLQQQISEGALNHVAPLLARMNSREKLLNTTLNNIDRALSRGLGITSLIFEYAQIAMYRPGSDVVSVPVLVTSVLDDLEDDFAEHRISVRVDVPEGCALIGNELHFHSILKNFVLNARDAVLEVEDESARAISIQAIEEPTRLVLSVQDTGIGIPADLHEKIFEPFFSTKPTTGTGLGLGMCRKLASIYGGAIDFDSGDRRGTTFRVVVPKGVPSLPDQPAPPQLTS